MSYPWWRFKITFQDGHAGEFTATGMGITDGLRTLLEQGDSDFEHDPLVANAIEHGGITKIEYLHCDTFGIDPESDAILSAEREERDHDE